MIKMGKKQLIINGHFEKGTIKNLKPYYKHIYRCDNNKCKRYYGADRIEKKPFLCPICIENGKKNKKM